MTEVEWRELRQHIILRDKRICQYCGERGHQVDYVVPAVHGGEPTGDNLVCCCGSCLKAVGVRRFPDRAAKAEYALTHRKQVKQVPYWLIRPRPPVTKPKAEAPSRLRDRLRAKRDREKRHELDTAESVVR